MSVDYGQQYDKRWTQESRAQNIANESSFAYGPGYSANAHASAEHGRTPEVPTQVILVPGEGQRNSRQRRRKSRHSRDMGHNYLGRKLVGLGSGMIALGVLSIAFTIVGMVENGNQFENDIEEGNLAFAIGTGIWCGALNVLAGAVAVAAGRRNTGSIIKASLGLSIVAIVAACAQFALSIYGVFQELEALDEYGDFWEWGNILGLAMSVLCLVIGAAMIGVASAATDVSAKLNRNMHRKPPPVPSFEVRQHNTTDIQPGPEIPLAPHAPMATPNIYTTTMGTHENHGYLPPPSYNPTFIPDPPSYDDTFAEHPSGAKY